MKAIFLLLLILSLSYNVESFKLKNVLKKIPKVMKHIAKETWTGLKHGPIHNNENWTTEKIIHAEYATRPLQCDISLRSLLENYIINMVWI